MATTPMILPILVPVTPVTPAVPALSACAPEGSLLQLTPAQYPERILVDKWLPSIAPPVFQR